MATKPNKPAAKRRRRGAAQSSDASQRQMELFLAVMQRDRAASEAMLAQQREMFTALQVQQQEMFKLVIAQMQAQVRQTSEMVAMLAASLLSRLSPSPMPDPQTTAAASPADPSPIA